MTPKQPSIVAMLLASFALGALGAALVVCAAGPPDPSPAHLFAGITAIATTSIAWQLSRP